MIMLAFKLLKTNISLMENNNQGNNLNLFGSPETVKILTEIESLRSGVSRIIDVDSKKEISPEDFSLIIDLLPNELQVGFLTMYKNLKVLQEWGWYDLNIEKRVLLSINDRLNQLIETLSDYLVQNEQNMKSEEIDSYEDSIQRIQSLINRINDGSFRKLEKDKPNNQSNNLEEGCLLVDDFSTVKISTDTFAL